SANTSPGYLSSRSVGRFTLSNNTTEVVMAAPKLQTKNSAQKTRFVVVGATSTAIDFGLLFVFRYLLNLPIIPSNITSTGIAFCFSFFANKKYTFRSTGRSVLRE